MRVPGLNIHRKQSTGFAENVTKSDFIRELVREIICEQNTSYMHAFYSTICIFNKNISLLTCEHEFIFYTM